VPSLRNHARALRVAWRTPGIIAAELESLLTANAESMTAHATPDILRVRRHASIALRWLSLLSRTWGTPWRNTCLFRSVTECLVLRAHGYRAQVVIGVARDSDPWTGSGEAATRRTVFAHAWVECDEFVSACGPGERAYHPLLSAAAPA
jgi:hypothetical protein